jgi:hypothetical protein
MGSRSAGQKTIDVPSVPAVFTAGDMLIAGVSGRCVSPSSSDMASSDNDVSSGLRLALRGRIFRSRILASLSPVTAPDWESDKETGLALGQAQVLNGWPCKPWTKRMLLRVSRLTCG